MLEYGTRNCRKRRRVVDRSYDVHEIPVQKLPNDIGIAFGIIPERESASGEIFSIRLLQK
jgi:hypothetical protein